MQINHFISGSVSQVVEGLLQAQKAVALYGVDIKTAGGAMGYSELDFDLAVTTRSNFDKGGDVELSILGVDLKVDKNNDRSHQIANRLRFSVQFSIPQAEMQKIAASIAPNTDNIA
ncbi:hypothetical protein N9X09_00745 [Flavobacteriaceae bacterium]|nr:hypothetical protein [Flavobacteriaceae bacterium]